MILVKPSVISEIDNYAQSVLGIPTLTLMQRAGHAVARAVRDYVPEGASIAIFAGKGNNGGDGYAAALELTASYDVTVYDVFGAGQNSDEGRHFLNEYTTVGGIVEHLTLDSRQLDRIRSTGCVVDAVFGTGYTGELPEIARELTAFFATLDSTVRIAVDVPLGINSELGTLTTQTPYCATATVVLGFVKMGLVSYPARKYVGKLVIDNIGLQNKDIIEHFPSTKYYVDSDLAIQMLPVRESDSHKGTYGRLLMMTGSESYPGAAHLSLESAMRSGVGYVTYLGDRALCDSLVLRVPEAIYRPTSLAELTVSELDLACAHHTAILVGSGLGQDSAENLFALLGHLLSTDGAPLILDADAINVLAASGESARRLIAASRRTVVLTPHPAELSRLIGISVTEIQSHRLEVAESVAAAYGCILVLKGAGTVVTDGTRTYINSSGCSALAKAGSGDVLAGHLASLVASGIAPIEASALAVYLHGLAADLLSDELSERGVIPSDLPRRIAVQIRNLERKGAES